MAKDSNTHKNHRKRMREKFLKAPDVMPDHELLEMLLFYSIPRADTNDIAHRLLDRCKSLGAVFDTDILQLGEVSGVGDSTVTMLKLLGEIYKRVEKEGHSKKKDKKITRKNIDKKLFELFFGAKEEKMIMICTDADCNMINYHTVAEGSASTTSVAIKKLIQFALADKATFVFLAHNHPNGVALPSKADIEATKAICTALSMVEVSVVEHYIVTKDNIVGIIANSTAE